MKEIFLNEEVQAILVSLLIAVFTLVGTLLLNLIKKKTSEILENTKNEKARNYIYLAERLVNSVVLTIQQTFIDELKSEGKVLTKEKANEAFLMAKANIIALLSVEAQKVLIEAYGDLDEWISTQIESNVKMLK